MKRASVLVCVVAALLTTHVSQVHSWTRQQCGDGDLVTEWGLLIDPYTELVLPEYPRPQLVRDVPWQNLNGLWEWQASSF